MNEDTTKFGLVGIAIVAVLAGVVLIAGCGGSDSNSESTSAEAGATAGGPGDMFASLTEDQKNCLDEAGVTLPETPEGAPQGGEMPEGQPPEGMTPPEGGTPGSGPPQGMPEGMQDLQSAMEECGIEMPEPPQGGGMPGEAESSGDGSA